MSGQSSPRTNETTRRPTMAATPQTDDIAVGERIRFTPNHGRQWWTVRDRDERYIVATAHAPFQPKGTLQYTVVDLTGWQDRRYNGAGNGIVRSSLNTLGGGWNIGADGTGAGEILPALHSGERELSHRRVVNVVAIDREADRG